MSDLIQTGFDYAALPVDSALTARAAAERIKLRLKRTVEDIIEIGRELTAVKEEFPHGKFLPWIAAEFEMTQSIAYNFMQVNDRFGGDKLMNFISFKPSVLYALAAPSTPDAVIDKAVEKAESGAKVTVLDVKDWKALEAELESERAAREKAERETEIWKTRQQESQQESNESRQKLKALELDLDAAKSQPMPIPVIVERVIEKIPADYETTLHQADALVKELDALKKQQSKLVNDQVKAKLQGYQSEVDEMERKKTFIQEEVDRLKAYMESLDSESKRIETHRSVIDGVRLELIGLAAFLNDLDPMNDPDTVKRWLALGEMNRDAWETIKMVFGSSQTLPSLS